MKYKISHNTTYKYFVGAEACHNVVRLRPRTTSNQTCSTTQLFVEPLPTSVLDYTDYFGNHVSSFAVYGPHAKLSITAESEVTVEERTNLDLASSRPWSEVVERLRKEPSEEMVQALEYVFDSPYIRVGPLLREFGAVHFPANRPIAEGAMALTKAIYRDFKYDPRATTIDTSIDDVLDKRRGVCQDFAHLQIGCMRSLGMACRYVSGYLRTDPQPGRPRLVGADASHAWLSVYCPHLGWIDFDPTNGCLTSDRHVTLAWGRDFHDVSPVKGVVLGGGRSSPSVAVDVLPIDESGSN